MIVRGLQLRWYREDDLPSLVNALRVCFPHENWTECDIDRFVTKKRGQIAKVILVNNVVVGPLFYRIADNHVRIARIGVLPCYRNEGTGRFAVNELIGPRSVFKTRRRFTAFVHEENKDAQLFFSKMGFSTSKGGNLVYDHFPGLADGIKRDAVVMTFCRKGHTKKVHRQRRVDC